jgi:hypothetical protein
MAISAGVLERIGNGKGKADPCGMTNKIDVRCALWLILRDLGVGLQWAYGLECLI